MKIFNAVLSATLQPEKKFPSATALQTGTGTNSHLQPRCKREPEQIRTCNRVANGNRSRFALATALQTGTGAYLHLQPRCKREFFQSLLRKFIHYYTLE